jgi:O-antigen/teichoic acid export membrane protein
LRPRAAELVATSAVAASSEAASGARAEVEGGRQRRALLRGSVLVVGATLVWHASNFGLNAVGAHLLGPTGYGSLTAVIALTTIAAPLFFAVQTVASRLTTTLGGRGEWGRVSGLVRFYGIRLVLGMTFCSAALAIASSAVARFLRVESALPVALLAPVLVLSLVTHLQRGVLQGARRFERYAASTVVEGATKIIAAVILLVVLWRSVDAAVIALAVASAAGVATNSVLLRFLPQRSAGVARGRLPLVRCSALTAGSLTLLALLLASDVLAAKRYLPAHDAGIYASVSLAGKIVFFGTSALSVYLFPFFSASRDAGRDARRLLALAAAVVATGAAVLIALYYLSPWAVVAPLFGSKYAAAEPYLGRIAIAFGCYALLYLATMYLLSQERGASIAVPAVLLLGQLSGLLAFHATIEQLVDVELATFAVGALVLGALCARGRGAARTGMTV